MQTIIHAVDFITDVCDIMGLKLRADDLLSLNLL